MQTATTKYKREYGLTVKQLSEQIMQREDNYYRQDFIKEVIYMFCDECKNALKNGEKLNLTGIGTLTPRLHASLTISSPITDGEEMVMPYVSIDYRKNTKLKDSLNSRYRQNIKNGFAGLSEHCICTTQQRNTPIRKGLLEGEIENEENDQEYGRFPEGTHADND